MGLETATYIQDLVVTNPVGPSDTKAQGDDHLRLIKTVLKNSFPNLVSAFNPTPAELDLLVGSTGRIVLDNGIGDPGQVARVPFAGGDHLEYWTPRGYISGLLVRNATGDPNNDVTISVGEASDSTAARVMGLSAELTKRLDDPWVAGDNVGGLFSGTKTSNATYHVFLIRKDSDGTSDVGYDTSFTAANRPAGYTHFRRIGSIQTDGSSNIEQFFAIELGKQLWVEWSVVAFDATRSGGTPILVVTKVPLGLTVIGNYVVLVEGTGSGFGGSAALTSGLAAAGREAGSPSGVGTHGIANSGFVAGVAPQTGTGNILIPTDTSGRIWVDSTVLQSGSTMRVWTQGYIDPRP
jgi:hypothetical protein